MTSDLTTTRLLLLTAIALNLLSACNSLQQHVSRREVFITTGTTAAAAATMMVSPPTVQAIDSNTLPPGLLESRVVSNTQSPPPYGMEGSDIFYPSWFAGSWNVYSECISVEAPCGIMLFGGNTTYQNAQNQVGPKEALRYSSRFRTMSSNNENNSPGAVIADREYNVKAIAQVAMGVNSVVDVSLTSPNQFSCLLLPEGSPSMLKVDLITLNRRQESISDYKFDCSEVVREIVAPATAAGSSSPLPTARRTILKEVETTSLYTFLPEKNKIVCQQRSATFLLPSQQDEVALRMWQATQGRPIDVRYYQVEYTPLKR